MDAEDKTLTRADGAAIKKFVESGGALIIGGGAQSGGWFGDDILEFPGN